MSAAVIVGGVAIELLKAYQTLKAQRDAATLADQERIAALDNQIVKLTAEDDAADAAADAELGLPPPSDT